MLCRTQLCGLGEHTLSIPKDGIHGVDRQVCHLPEAHQHSHDHDRSVGGVSTTPPVAEVSNHHANGAYADTHEQTLRNGPLKQTGRLLAHDQLGCIADCRSVLSPTSEIPHFVEDPGRTLLSKAKSLGQNSIILGMRSTRINSTCWAFIFDEICCHP